MKPNIEIPQKEIAEFCRKWHIEDLSLFGSALREDFRPDSDIDVLVRFSPEARWGLFDMTRMQEELKTIFGRNVDLVERSAVEHSRNYVRRKAILSNLEAIYAAR
ncbi:MAG: nucleotidyltransferase family protein [Deltaproteobacteria bacterium]|nr:nucleotidyltransferase family protein [Deltaproteobacteria bacterium]